MNNHEAMKMFFTNFSGQNNTLTIPKPYLILTGDINKALVLNQMIFYTGITARKDRYFYKTYKEWEDETFLTQYQIKKITEEFKELGYVETKLKRANGSPTLHYTVNLTNIQNAIMKKLDKRLQSNYTNDKEETSSTVTESYTESYTEKEKNIVGQPDVAYKKIIDYLNLKTDKSYKSTTRKTQDLIKARINEGFTKDDCMKVIDIKANEWQDDVYMKKYLRPETLFGTKFEGYLNQESPKKKGYDPSTDAF